ncbi:DUF6230 family protein [Janibacter sp. GS2]|uniref:DUF6230 family protein n=1 Tax=Janibacter sp. GS2 TaxID=3442646 RepID=UPI003EBD927D
MRRRPAVLAGGGGLLAMGLLAALVSHSAFAVGLTAAHEDTRIYMDGLSGSGVGLSATTATHAAEANGAMAVERARVGLQLQDVEVNGLCLVATHDIPGVGTTSAVITAGEAVDGRRSGRDPVRFESLALDLSSIEGQARDVDDLALGQSAQNVPGGGAAGEFGIAARSIAFDELALSSGALDLSSGATLPGLRVRTLAGAADRSDCP